MPRPGAMLAWGPGHAACGVHAHGGCMPCDICMQAIEANNNNPPDRPAH